VQSTAEALKELIFISKYRGLGDDYKNNNIPKSKLPYILYIIT
jgi:hypothetical protein